MAFQENVLAGTDLTRENFTHPPLEMGIVPFWFWNGDLDAGEMEWQLNQFYDRGIRSLFIHGRMGLNVPYLSEAWFERVRFAVEKAKEIGIDAWIYDEMDWPSGTADGQVMAEDPELCQRYLELVPLMFDGPIFNFLEAHDDRYVNTGNANPVAAYGVRRDQYENGIRELVDLNKNLAWEKTIPWEAPEGKWVLLYFLEKQDPYYIDTLNPSSTEKFITLTHERYKQAVGDEFGKTVPGFFTDEPAMYYYHVGLKNYVIPWSKQMFKIFRQRRGYDLKPYLPALYLNMGEKTTQVRYDFWRTLTEQYAETYYKRLRDWCEENGVIFTGHVLFEELLRLAARCEGNIFKYLQQMHMIGVDHLYPKIGTAREPEQHVALKLGSSAAHHFGSPRLLCESMGGTYWDCTLERMKWINNWEYVLGVNLFNNHGYHYTIEGERKRDWPPSQFYHHTWWKYYDRFTAYNARLSHILTGGKHVANVLMLYPINSIWTNYTPQAHSRIGDLIEADFNYLTDTLLRLHHDFDYVDEDVLAGADIRDGRIHIREEAFEVFILPPVTHIKESTLERLQAFVAGGGKLIATTLLPVGLLETRDQGAVADLEDFFGFDPLDVLKRFEAAGEVSFDLVRSEAFPTVFFLQGEGLHSKKIHAERLVAESGGESRAVRQFLAAEAGSRPVQSIESYIAAQSRLDAEKRDTLRNLLGDCVTPDVVIDDEEVFYLHRVKNGRDLYLVANTTRTNRRQVALSFARKARPELWNPNTGEITPLHCYWYEGERLCLKLDFPPSEAYVVMLEEESAGDHITETNLHIAHFGGDRLVGYAERLAGQPYAVVSNHNGHIRLEAEAREPLPDLQLPDEYRFTVEQDNVLVIDRWKMRLEEEDAAGYHLPEYDDAGWLAVTNGAWEMQLPQERDEAVYPVTLWYRTHFEASHLPSNTRLMIDGFSGKEYSLYVNGLEIKDSGVRSWLDAEIREVDIQPFLKRGRNSVVVRLIANRRTDGMLDLLKIVGDFGLGADADGTFRIMEKPSRIQIGDWTAQGFPFFSGTGVYRGTFKAPPAYLDGGRLFLEAECGEDVLEVSLNGADPVVVPWHPYRVDVTEMIKEGENTVEMKITNTLAGILGGEQKPAGLFRRPILMHEHRYELAARAAASV